MHRTSCALCPWRSVNKMVSTGVGCLFCHSKLVWPCGDTHQTASPNRHPVKVIDMPTMIRSGGQGHFNDWTWTPEASKARQLMATHHQVHGTAGASPPPPHWSQTCLPGRYQVLPPFGKDTANAAHKETFLATLFR